MSNFEKNLSLLKKKKRIYKALLDSKSDEVLNFDVVLSRIING